VLYDGEGVAGIDQAPRESIQPRPRHTPGKSGIISTASTIPGFYCDGRSLAGWPNREG
jgi:hypothetical protein